ncbi:Heat shock protein 70 [Pseudarthrobacter chlorophenolicus A6]|uniref:Heat shock protein 70 n=1 Tax=Pseudarthrobacter chlorophenolicus (strain ATCC 700700 / DSM 12829 / CIP 107037 / JCM 12360 / KCTC 9906 / NCIMB 13794 / A6) TaxID=452863 RepID=B8HF80_PSECP|nr:Hsp70 family protein [Pseudarthrobacter chlorophenolicus]ACL41048.1 Heat shock protein 70 [Pseudarthrobacter chlorophenolicus A6]SDQ70740.1 Hsp70 protein [Pseudarthrobacter chlorophenolicus]
MTYVLAVDVGTSFTAAAVVRFHQGVPPVPECLPLGLRGTAVPSVVYYPEQGPILVGEAAERRGLATPERVVREFKRRIGDAVPIALGTLSVRPEEVFASVARWVADRAAEREGAAPSEIILTHPAAWGSHRTSAVREALAAKGLHDVTLLAEPEAAALHYASQVRVEEGSTIAVYDLGGGTFDTAVLTKAGDDRFEAVGRPEGIDDLGGADFDAAVFRYVAEHTGEALADLDPADPDVLAALSRLRRECVEAKEALSSDSEATIPVLLPGYQQQVRLVRSDFEALIEEPVRETVDALEESLAQLKLAPADLTAVLLIGGSSRIPLVAELISEQLDRPIAVDADPKSSICLGAAVSAVLSRAAAERAAAPATDAPQLPVPASGDEGLDAGGHVPARLASWSRKGTTAAGAFAALGHGHGHGGAHAPKPTVRLTAIAAAAALFTVLTATAAQSPGGLSDLTSVFVPQAGADSGPPAQAGGAGSVTGGGGPAAAGTAGDAQPLAGIDAGVQKKKSDAGPGLNVEASPTSKPSAAATKAPDGSPAPAAGGSTPAAGTGAAPGTPGSVPASTPTTAAGTVDPAPGTPEPVPTDPATVVPAPDPTTNPPLPDPTTNPPLPDPTTNPPLPDPTTNPPLPDPTTNPPVPETPAPSSAPVPDPTPAPDPAPVPDPAPTPAAGSDAPTAEPAA